jgi:hypothetical protein
MRFPWDKPDPRQPIGIVIRYGAPGTPVDQHEDLRFDPVTRELLPGVLVPASGIAQWLDPDRPREASPTGKSGKGISIVRFPNDAQPLQLAKVHGTIMRDRDPIYPGTHLTTQSMMDPAKVLSGQRQTGPRTAKWNG